MSPGLRRPRGLRVTETGAHLIGYEGERRGAKRSQLAQRQLALPDSTQLKFAAAAAIADEK